jgi:CrcB protein
MNSIYTWLGIFAGGGIGSVIRFLLSIAFRNSGMRLPLGTLAANVIAVIIMIVFTRIAEHSNMNQAMRAAIFTGFCGGLSTFSTFSVESAMMFRNGQTFWAIANIVISVVLCVGVMYFSFKKA